MKKMILILALSVFAATAAFAVEGKVKSVADGSVVVDLAGDASLKKGNNVKLNGKTGKVTAIEGNVVTIKSKVAEDLKAGDAVKVEKASASMQGC